MGTLAFGPHYNTLALIFTRHAYEAASEHSRSLDSSVQYSITLCFHGVYIGIPVGIKRFSKNLFPSMSLLTVVTTLQLLS